MEEDKTKQLYYRRLLSKLPREIHWEKTRWVRCSQMLKIWEGDAGQIPIEIVFGNYLLRAPHSMIWVHLEDETRGEPFDIWEIRLLKHAQSDEDFDESQEEVIGDDDWDNVLVENGCDVHTMVKFLKRCLFQDKMAIYTRPREKWQRLDAEKYETEHNSEES